MTKLATSSLRIARDERGLKTNRVSGRDTAPRGRDMLRRVIGLPRAAGLVEDTRFSVERIRDPHRLNALLADWRDLAAYAAEANPFYEEWMLRPALAHLGNRSVQVLAVWEETPVRRLIGLMPVRLRGLYRGVPARVAEPWVHLHCFLATPLLREGRTVEALEAMIAHLRRTGLHAIRFPHAAGDGPFAAALDEVAGKHRLDLRETNRFDRAILKSDLDGEAYIAENITKKRRKEFARLSRRLADEGKVEFERADMTDDACIEGVALEFLALEGAGWKGETATAMTCRPREKRYFLEICRAAAEQGRLKPLTMRLDGHPIAAIVNFIGGDGLFSFKIAYDERLARFSPGVLLELELTKMVQADPDIGFADSCAMPDHPMIDHLWRERREIRDVFIATQSHPTPLLMPLLAGIDRAERSARRLARQCRDVIRRRMS